MLQYVATMNTRVFGKLPQWKARKCVWESKWEIAQTCSLLQPSERENCQALAYSTFTLRRPVYKNSSAEEFFTWMCESIESCDYQCNHRISTCLLYSYHIPERHDVERKVCACNWRTSFSEYTITLIIYSNLVAVECAKEDIRSYQWSNATWLFRGSNVFCFNITT